MLWIMHFVLTINCTQLLSVSCDKNGKFSVITKENSWGGGVDEVCFISTRFVNSASLATYLRADHCSRTCGQLLRKIPSRSSNHIGRRHHSCSHSFPRTTRSPPPFCKAIICIRKSTTNLIVQNFVKNYECTVQLKRPIIYVFVCPSSKTDTR